LSLEERSGDLVPDDIITRTMQELLRLFVPQKRAQAEQSLRQLLAQTRSGLYQLAHDLETGAAHHREIDRLLAANPALYEDDYDAYMALYDLRFGAQDRQSPYQWLLEILSQQEPRRLRGMITALKLVAFLH
jgi:hypothetical protein